MPREYLNCVYRLVHDVLRELYPDPGQPLPDDIINRVFKTIEAKPSYRALYDEAVSAGGHDPVDNAIGRQVIRLTRAEVIRQVNRVPRGINSSFSLLRRPGDKTPSTTPESEANSVMPELPAEAAHWWIEKTEVTNNPERAPTGHYPLGQILWSPQRSKSGADIYRFMRHVAPGDFILHLTDRRAFSGISRAVARYREAAAPGSGGKYDVDAYCIPLAGFTPLVPPLDRDVFLSPPFIERLDALAKSGTKNLFYDKRGIHEGGYLTPAPPELVSILQDAYTSISGARFPVLEILDGRVPPANGTSGEHPAIRPRFELDLLREETDRRRLKVSDEILAAVLAALKAGKDIILTGPPGTGKTTLAESVAAAATAAGLAAGYVLTTATSDWTTFDTVGGLRPSADNSKLEFAPGQFVSAIRQNYWLIIDELNRANFDRAFGQLFTVLSGQAVQLPFADPESGRPIQLVPESASPAPATEPIIVHKSWRTVGTMNVFDKSLLFTMSFALMRRFAFIEVGAPDEAVYLDLIRSVADGDEEHGKQLENYVAPFLRLRTIKELGPAVFIDVARYASERLRLGPSENTRIAFQLFYSYLLPQFEGIDDSDVRNLFRLVRPLVGNTNAARLSRTLRDVLGAEVRLGFPGMDSTEDVDPDDVSEEPEAGDGDGDD